LEPGAEELGARRPGPGRRPGKTDTRGQILGAARTEFAAKGFDRTTIRAVATAAEVDPALVHHYFGTKTGLFVAAMDLPFDPRVIVPTLVGQGLDGLGERIARFFLAIWDVPESRNRILGLIRSAVTVDSAAVMAREFLEHVILEPVAEAVGLPDARLRVALVGSHLMGLAMVRHVLEVEPLASASADEIVRWVGPTLQAYLTA
jgi:AcrR family transcriptional regulator